MKRIEYIDHARAFGMFFVFYAHFVEKLYRSSDSLIAFEHWRFVCSFLMQFFFFLAGIFWKPVPFSWSFFVEKMKTRLLPSIFFSLLLIPLWLTLRKAGFWIYLAKREYLWGKPLDYMMWFVICLMTTEIITALIARYFRVDRLRMAAYAAALFFFSYYVLINQRDAVRAITGINPKVWFLDTALMMLLFYVSGYLCKDILVKFSGPKGRLLSLVIVPVSFFLLWAILMAHPDHSLVVLVSVSAYGHIGYFLATSIVGIIFLIALSRLFSARIPWINFIGQNTLIFLGLNGVSYHFLDARMIKIFGFMPSTSFGVFAYATVYVIAVLLLYSVFALALRRWVPELTGYDWSPTSLLPSISKAHQR